MLSQSNGINRYLKGEEGVNEFTNIGLIDNSSFIEINFEMQWIEYLS